MSTVTQSFPTLGPVRRLPLAAAFEVLGYLGVVGIGTLCFLLGWLHPNEAAVLTVILLSALILLAWNRFHQGRHPCFLFLCVLMLFQCGRLIGYCAGAIPDPLRVELLTTNPFTIPNNEAGITLLSIVLSAICIYAPCRFYYQRFSPPSDVEVRRYLPYLYLLFFATLPIQLFKNYRYYEYAQEHGGYLFIFLRHGDLASSVPLFVRAISLVSLPAFVAIFVFEKRKGLLSTVTVLYFATASLILLLGSRGSIFALVLALWYAARVKSRKKPRILLAAGLALVLILVADVVRTVREGSIPNSNYVFLPVEFLATQGVSLNVTEVAVKYRELFAPHVGSYLLSALQDAFVASDTSNYFRGKALASDVAVFLNPEAFTLGQGTGSSYVGEAYVIGGVGGVMVISLLIGLGFHLLHRFSRNPFSLFVVAMVLLEVLLMPRGNLVDWFSVLMRNAISIMLLLAGWKIYALLTSIRHTASLPPAQLTAGPMV